MIGSSKDFAERFFFAAAGASAAGVPGNSAGGWAFALGNWRTSATVVGEDDMGSLAGY